MEKRKKCKKQDTHTNMFVYIIYITYNITYIYNI